MTMKRSPLHETITSCQRQVESTAKRCNKLLDAEDFLQPIFDHFPDDCHVSEYGMVTISMTVPAFTSIGSPALLEALEWLDNYLQTPCESQPLPGIGIMTYNFKLPQHKLSIELDAKLLENSDLCYRKVVGTRRKQEYRMVDSEEPMFAFVC